MDNQKKFHCETCNYSAVYKSEFNKHLKSAKHKRGGKYTDYKCNECDYKGLNKWNLTVHQATTHYTIEQKKKLKYYCEICDFISFSELYHNNHINSTHHKSNEIIHNSKIGNSINVNVIKDTSKKKDNNMEENLKKYMKELIDDLGKKILDEINKK